MKMGRGEEEAIVVRGSEAIVFGLCVLLMIAMLLFSKFVD